MTSIYCVTYAMTATTGIVSFICLTFMYNFVQLNAKIDLDEQPSNFCGC